MAASTEGLLDILWKLYLLGSLAKRVGGRAVPTGLSLGLSRKVSVEGLSPPPGHRREAHLLSWESVKAGSHLMASGWNLYRVVMGLERLGMVKAEVTK